MRTSLGFTILTLSLLLSLSDCGRITAHFGGGAASGVPESPPPDGSTGGGGSSGGSSPSTPDAPQHKTILSWTASTSTGLTGYNIYRGDVSGGPYSVIGSVPASTLTYVDLNVTAGATHYYVATSYIASPPQESAYSVEVSGTTPTP